MILQIHRILLFYISSFGTINIIYNNNIIKRSRYWIRFFFVTTIFMEQSTSLMRTASLQCATSCVLGRIQTSRLHGRPQVVLQGDTGQRTDTKKMTCLHIRILLVWKQLPCGEQTACAHFFLRFIISSADRFYRMWILSKSNVFDI